MLLFGSTLIDQAIMSLQTGGELARTSSAVIDPYRLVIRAYKLTGAQLEEPDNTYIRIEDVREIGNIGFIIDSNDEIICGTDIIKLKKLIDLDFSLVGLKVIDQAENKIGTVIDYSIDVSTFMIYQLVVKRPFWQSFNDPELIIDRSKIIELNNQRVIIKDNVEKAEPSPLIKETDFINPFRIQKEAESIEN